MLKQILFCAGLLMFPAASSSAGEPMASSPRTVSLPGTGFHIAVGAAVVEQGSTRIEPGVLTAVAAWLSSNYDLPPADEPPAIAFVPREAMAALRHGNARSDHWSASRGKTDQGAAPHASTVVAIYDDLDRTIYLPEGWTGSTPTELSVLVHEMVHHLQNLAALPFACHEEREQLAYAAQREWLALFGRDLLTDFGTDAFTLMARTHCAY
jgi:hypothetical protein